MGNTQQKELSADSTNSAGNSKQNGSTNTTKQTIATQNMIAASTDDQYRAAKETFKGHKVCVQYSSMFCDKCHSMLPHFMNASRQHTDMKYVLSQIDYFQEEGMDIKYLPMYRFYDANGKKVDEFFGVKPQKLEDHVWLHAEWEPQE